MKILVTGPRGFVGARIMEAVEGACAAPSLRGMGEAEVMRLVESEEPDCVIHTAAISDIGACERSPEASWHANVEIPLWLARTGVRMVLFSTDQVYSGSSGEGPYREEEAEPANVYARHKLEMEERVLRVNPDAVLLRATWMYDMPMYGTANRGNFLMNMLRMKEISFSPTQHRAVTYVREVAQQISTAMRLPGGVYNYGSENEYTILETARFLKEELSLPVRIQEAGARHHLWMDCSRAAALGIRFSSTVDGLKKCIADYAL